MEVQYDETNIESSTEAGNILPMQTTKQMSLMNFPFSILCILPLPIGSRSLDSYILCSVPYCEFASKPVVSFITHLEESLPPLPTFPLGIH